jgi:hypothetical protein
MATEEEQEEQGEGREEEGEGEGEEEEEEEDDRRAALIAQSSGLVGLQSVPSSGTSPHQSSEAMSCKRSTSMTCLVSLLGEAR